MDYKLEHNVRITHETKYKNLYEWCLREFDDSGKQVGQDQTPWPWSFYFIGSSFKVVNSVSIEKKSVAGGPENSIASQTTKIVGTLHSGFSRNGDEVTDVVNFSIFGTSRKIQNFQVCIYQVNDDQTEACFLTVIPSYETEIDFSNEITDDFVGFDVQLHKDKFSRLVHLIETKSADSVWLRVGEVSGVYSEWSPSITTYKAKFLSRNNTVEGLAEGESNPPSVGEVKEFDLNFEAIKNLNLAPYIPQVDDANLIEPTVSSLKSLKTVLWCIFGVLFLLLIK